MGMEHREGQRRAGLEGKLCFWKQYFHGLWQDVLCTSSDGARAGTGDGKWALQEICPFLFSSEQSEADERISALPQVPLQYIGQ